MRFSISDKVVDSDEQSADELCDRYSNKKIANEECSAEVIAPSICSEILPAPIDGKANNGESGDFRPHRSSHRMRTVPVDEDDAGQSEESSVEGAGTQMLNARRAQIVISASGVYSQRTMSVECVV